MAGEVKRQNLRPIQRPEVPGMALRDGSMCDAKLVPWESSTPTGVRVVVGCYG